MGFLTDGVAVEAFPQQFRSLSKAVGYQDYIDCLCYLLPPFINVLCEAAQCVIQPLVSSTYY